MKESKFTVGLAAGKDGGQPQFAIVKDGGDLGAKLVQCARMGGVEIEEPTRVFAQANVTARGAHNIIGVVQYTSHENRTKLTNDDLADAARGSK